MFQIPRLALWYLCFQVVTQTAAEVIGTTEPGTIYGPTTSTMAGTDVCFEGYVMDRFCINRETLLDNDGVRILLNPEKHSVHCLVDEGRCRDSGYEILAPLPTPTSTAAYCPAYRIGGASGFDKTITLARELGDKNNGSTTCTGSGTVDKGFHALFVGRVSASAIWSAAEPPVLEVSQVLEAGSKCPNGLAQTQPSCDSGVTTTPADWVGYAVFFMICFGCCLVGGLGIGVVIWHNNKRNKKRHNPRRLSQNKVVPVMPRQVSVVQHISTHTVTHSVPVMPRQASVVVQHMVVSRQDARDFFMDSYVVMSKAEFEEYWHDAAQGAFIGYDKLMKKVNRFADAKRGRYKLMKEKGDRQFNTQMRKPSVGSLSALPEDWRNAVVPKTRPDASARHCVEVLDMYMDNLKKCGKFHPSDPMAFDKTMQAEVKPFWGSIIAMYQEVLGTEAARSQVRYLLSHLAELYESMYDGMFKQEVQEGDPEGFRAFNEEVNKQLDLLPDPAPCRQVVSCIEVMYRHAVDVHKKYNRQCKDIAELTHGEFTPAPLKHVFRAIEKSALRPDEHARFECTNVYDVVRGALVYDTMAGVATGLQAVCTQFTVVRIKNRFLPVGQAASSGGWRDVVVNMRVTDDPHKHVLEVQIQLRCLVNVRSGLGGHFIYAKYRALSEALEVCGHDTHL